VPTPSHSASTPTVAIACGGTGGHFYPGLSIAREWQEQGGRAVLLIGGRHQKQQIETARGLHIEAFPTQSTPRPGNKLALPLFAGKLVGHVVEARSLLTKVDAQVTLCMGSYTSVPIGLASAFQKIPLILHDGNACCGRANRFLARWAQGLAMAFPAHGDERIHRRQPVVGMPLRRELLDAAASPRVDSMEREMMCRSLNLDPARPILLVFGGSQGAAFINRQMIAAIDGWRAPEPFQVVHIAGPSSAGELEAAYTEAGVGSRIIAFDPHIERYYRLADLVICRAGGSSIAELTVMGKSALLIPFAAALDNHQKANAEYLVSNQAAMMLSEESASAAAIRIVIARWLLEPDEIARYGDRARKLARPDATRDMVDLLRRTMRGAIEEPAED